ncbi:hypothetical protein ACFLXU_03630 [Chloroflexota bacterium]
MRIEKGGLRRGKASLKLSFGRAEKVRNDGKEREIVVLEVDGTMIHSQEKGEDAEI